MIREEIQKEIDQLRNKAQWANAMIKTVESDPYYIDNPQEMEVEIQKWTNERQAALSQKSSLTPLLLHAMKKEDKDLEQCIVIL